MNNPKFRHIQKTPVSKGAESFIKIFHNSDFFLFVQKSVATKVFI